MPNTLRKSERLHFDKVIGRMFQQPAGSFVSYPLRVVFLRDETLEVPSAILISVSKRRFKHAVDRNRIKRQIRESYRLEKEPLIQCLEAAHLKVAVSFIYVSAEHTPSPLIRKSMQEAVSRLCRVLIKKYAAEDTRSDS